MRVTMKLTAKERRAGLDLRNMVGAPERRSKGRKICPACGWYTHEFSPGQCDPKRGAMADKLIAAVPTVPSTKLGYGFGHLAFEPDENFHMQFEPNRRGGTFALEDVWLLDALTHDQAADLVQTLAAWRKRCIP